MTFAPRHSGAAFLPLHGEGKTPSIKKALDAYIDSEKALDVQANGDIVEIIETAYDRAAKTLALLIHRASPSASDPAYRKKARAAAGKKPLTKFTIRNTVRNKGEEPSVSAHLVIREKNVKLGKYRAVLEEIPGINMAVVRQIMAKALFDYTFEFAKKGKQETTYTTVKAEGLKSETMESALKKGEIDYVTLVRQAKPDFVDAHGIFVPRTETMMLKVTQQITPVNFKGLMSALFTKAKAAGWEQFNIDISLDDKRTKTVKLDKEQDAKELLFVRSEQVAFDKELSQCAPSLSQPIVIKATALASKA
ncbi:hypothetical protein NKJ23_28580 [Mesorhizobium sp. M0184]|uniref:hypothetical protein n=1 Tax=Mesorhizobium sp. M0184 TaxID=2956906 RepID=UPI003336F68E